MSRTSRLILVGAAAGLFASWAMEQSQRGLYKVVKSAGLPKPNRDPSTVKAADMISEAITGHPVEGPKRKPAGRAIHYVTGAGLGVVYTLIAERIPLITAGFGGLYGLLVSAVLDEMIVPEAGLAPPADQAPLDQHAQGIAAHVAFGSALETARRTLRFIA